MRAVGGCGQQADQEAAEPRTDTPRDARRACPVTRAHGGGPRADGRRHLLSPAACVGEKCRETLALLRRVCPQ